MALIATRRSVMTLFSAPLCVQSHRVRIVLAEKDITVDVINIDPNDKPEDLSDLNPYNSVPTLVDRDLALYGPQVITEYLDERFPHPPLMPVDPVSRAAARLALYRIERDWYSIAEEAEGNGLKLSPKSRKILQESLVASADVFAIKPYFLSDEFSLVDCAILPILWRLPAYGIAANSIPKPIAAYAKRLFNRPSFKQSLTEAERELQP
jgi:stringent starvation protein A